MLRERESKTDGKKIEQMETCESRDGKQRTARQQNVILRSRASE